MALKKMVISYDAIIKRNAKIKFNSSRKKRNTMQNDTRTGFTGSIFDAFHFLLIQVCTFCFVGCNFSDVNLYLLDVFFWLYHLWTVPKKAKIFQNKNKNILS